MAKTKDTLDASFIHSFTLFIQEYLSTSYVRLYGKTWGYNGKCTNMAPAIRIYDDPYYDIQRLEGNSPKYSANINY